MPSWRFNLVAMKRKIKYRKRIEVPMGIASKSACEDLENS